MTATLLCCDAWLDVLSSVGQGRSATVAAVGEAAFAELPLAALFAWVAARFAGAVAEARPSLRRAGFLIRHLGANHLGIDSGYQYLVRVTGYPPVPTPRLSASTGPPGREHRSCGSTAAGSLAAVKRLYQQAVADHAQ